MHFHILANVSNAARNEHRGAHGCIILSDAEDKVFGALVKYLVEDPDAPGQMGLPYHTIEAVYSLALYPDPRANAYFAFSAVSLETLERVEMALEEHMDFSPCSLDGFADRVSAAADKVGHSHELTVTVGDYFALPPLETDAEQAVSEQLAFVLAGDEAEGVSILTIQDLVSPLSGRLEPFAHLALMAGSRFDPAQRAQVDSPTPFMRFSLGSRALENSPLLITTVQTTTSPPTRLSCF